jgi:hypothetical protein
LTRQGAQLQLADLSKVSGDHIRAAGARYTPALDPNAPNLKIESLLRTIEALCLSNKYKTRLKALSGDVLVEAKDANRTITELFEGGRYRPQIVASLLKRLARERPRLPARTISELDQACSCVSGVLEERRRVLWGQDRQSQSSEEKQETEGELYKIGRLATRIRAVGEFVEAPESKVITTNRLFIRGEWGTGKTHFLCDVAKSRISEGLPTLFLLAHRLKSDVDILGSLCRSTGFACSGHQLLRELNRLGQESNGRALLIIDGINEAGRVVWRRGIMRLAQEISRHRNLGLILSCRSPFDVQILSSRARRQFIHVAHPGFDEIEFDAQREFFRYYAIPNPDIPLLTPEFSRPLFLKILCETFAGKSASAKSRRIREIALGQKSMTKLLEDFVDTVGRPIEIEFGLGSKTCWRILKGDKSKSSGKLVGIAATTQLKWRILNLGYDPKKFDQIDRSISEAAFRSEGRRPPFKIDRYGKKYSWIAYFELCGMRADQNLLPDLRDGHRVTDCDIDPSFPELASEWKPPLKPLITGPFKTARAWAKNGPSPSYEHLLSVAEINGIAGPWILLNGYIGEGTAADTRRAFTFLRGLLTKPSDTAKLVQRARSTEYPGNRAIPESWEDHYTYAGEVPWSRRFGWSLRGKTGDAKRLIEEALAEQRHKRVRKRVADLTPFERFRIQLIAAVPRFGEVPKRTEPAEENAPPRLRSSGEFVEVDEYVRVPGVRVELPGHRFAWESYHSAENQVGGIEIPAPALCEVLGLRNRGATLDLVDASGRTASIYRVFRGDEAGFASHLLYLRADLLESYLAKTKQDLVWVNWGERDFHHTGVEQYRQQLQDIWGEHSHIHRSIVVKANP